MAEGDQDHGRIPVTVTVGIGRLDQDFDLAGREVLTVRSSAFGRRIGATARKILAGAISLNAEFVNEIASPARQLSYFTQTMNSRQATKIA
jgi:hypothetical protein